MHALPMSHSLMGVTSSHLQVRFHPLDSDLFASGSLDHRVVVWRISTGEKVYTHDFGESSLTLCTFMRSKTDALCTFGCFMKILTSCGFLTSWPRHV